MNRQYHYQKELKYYILFFVVFFIVMFFINKWLHTSKVTTFYVEAKAEAASITPTPSPTIAASRFEGRVYFDLFKKYFGDDAEVMYAIAQAESGLVPTKINRWGDPDNIKRGECSIGLMQINLKSNNCEGGEVHWRKVPGATLEEKIEWLKVPENNLKVAKKIYDASGLSPWSAYTNGAYKKFLD